MFPTASVATWISDTHAALRSDETTAPASLQEIASQQLGILSCGSGGTHQTDGAYDDALDVAIAADGADGYDANVPEAETDTSLHATNTAGDKSEYGCYVENEEFQCIGNVLVGTAMFGMPDRCSSVSTS
jgi:hypothetical protein